MEENKPVTIGRIFYVAFRRWKLFVPVAALVALTATLLISLVYNPMKGKYTSTFSYSALDLKNEVYADGSPFTGSSLISKDNLNKVKASNEAFASIDVDKLVDSGNISIDKEKVEGKVSDDSSYEYTISVGSKFFKSFDLAKSFVAAVVNSALEKDNEIADSFSVGNNLSSFDSLTSFEAQINSLYAVSTTLFSLYDQIIESEDPQPAYIYSLAYEGQRTLENNFSSRNVSSLKAEITTYGFVKDYSVINLDETKTLLTQEYADNGNKLTAYTSQYAAMGGGAAVTELPIIITQLTDRNAELVEELAAIDAKIANKSKYDSKDADYMARRDAFIAELANYKLVVENETKAYRTFLNAAYVDRAEASFDNANVIQSRGSINIAITIAISLLAGVVVGMVANLIVDRKKLIA